LPERTGEANKNPVGITDLWTTNQIQDFPKISE
jgi:hypothetical protein